MSTISVSGLGNASVLTASARGGAPCTGHPTQFSDHAPAGSAPAGPGDRPNPVSPRFAAASRLGRAVAARVLLTALGMVVVSFGVGLGAQFALAASGLGPNVTVLIGCTTVGTAGVCVAWLLRRFFEGDRHGQLCAGWRGGRALADLGIGLAAAALAMVVSLALSVAAGLIEVDSTGISLTGFLVGLPGAIAISFVLQGIPEEFLWRGYFQTTVAERIAPWTAAVLGAVAFGLLHFVSNGSGNTVWSKLVYVAAACGLGFACAALRLHTGSVWAAVGFHGGMHITNRVLQVWIVGEHGPVAVNALQGAMMLAVGLVCLVLHRRRVRSQA